ncbi:MAG TPA: ATP-binding protein [Candidatus Polarisedimenticolaceae bacterium]|nr:ATP-binding protein [Candidatus Polarisedimenticolaceae bacterium]
MGRVKILAMLVAATLPFAAHAARAPIRHYTATDGFAESHVNRLKIDPSGVVWIAGASGLWKFDGERFDLLGADLGLPRAEVQDIALAGDGLLWVATDVGLFRGDPSQRKQEPVFARFEFPSEENGSAPAPFRLLAAGDGTIWVGTRHGLWRIPPTGGGASRIDGVPQLGRVTSLAEGPGGAVWVGTHRSGLYRIARDGRVDHHDDAEPGYGFVSDFMFDDDGSVWTAFLGGVAHFTGDPFASPAPGPAILGESDGISISPSSLLRVDRDRFLIGTLAGIDDVRRDASGRFKVEGKLDRSSGLPDAAVQTVAFDREGNLWCGMFYRGLAKRVASGFTQHDEVDAQRSIIIGVAGDREGRVAVLTRGETSLTLYTSGAADLVARALTLPFASGLVGWRTAGQFAQDPSGDWWVGGSMGLLRFHGATPVRAPAGGSDLERAEASAVFVAANGDLWIGSPRGESEASTLSCRHPGGTITTFPSSAIGTHAVAYAFAEDAAHDIWIAFEDGRILRYRDGNFERLPVPVAALAEAPFFVDRAGALWILGQGLAVSSDPASAHPAFERQPLPARYADLATTCGTEDRDGRFYFGTTRGVLRLDRKTGAFRLFTDDDGLPRGEIRYAFRDTSDRLWFADAIGLAQLIPGPDPPSFEAPIRIRSITVEGTPLPLAPLGASSVGPLSLRAGERTLRIEYLAVHHAPGSSPQFRTKLEGADSSWSAPTDERSVVYSNLAPGHYRFLVTSATSNGGSPATVVFHVAAPFYKRGWFVSLVAVLGVAAAFGAYRVRVAHLLTLERLRTRIATDLHDEVGSSLSQIAVLSQVAEQAPAPRALGRITELAGSLVDAMSDTVWAISPGEDRLSDLVHRMRRFGADLFADGAATVQLDLPEAHGDERLEPDVRRAIYLVFKESLHNIHKHARARHVRVALERRGGGFRLTIGDDGRGFDHSAITPGHGLASMRARAEALDGRLNVESVVGSGTRVVLDVLRPKRSLARWIVWRRRNRM